MIFAASTTRPSGSARPAWPATCFSKIHFWGWQLIIVSAALTLPLGITQGKEYAELDLADRHRRRGGLGRLRVNFFWTLAKRNEKHLYVALWFYIATIVTVAMLYIVNNPRHRPCRSAAMKSYPIYGGAQDALVQWWYGHNAVAFFLTTPILGIMYYFLPKAAQRPVFSYRLSIIHFWAWSSSTSGPAPTTCSTRRCPSGLQTLGMLFSLMLWAPSWGGMLNGLLTLRGAWNKLRRDPVLKFFVVGGDLLRDVDLRGAAALDQGGQRAQPLHRLDDRSRPRRYAGLERLHGRRHALLAGAPALREDQAPACARQSASCTSGSAPSASCLYGFIIQAYNRCGP
jgi:cytochrome c oxidase cbb3-type subunit I/II